MPAAAKKLKVDELAAKLGDTVARRSWFEAERLGVKALSMGRQEHDFQLMARVTPLLAAARMGRLQQALDIGRITIVQQPITEETRIEPGCFLIQPPHVGADARRLRLAALQQEAPIAVICREPLTQLRCTPVVAIAPGATVRVRIDPPANQDQPDLDWFVAALQALGDGALEELDDDLTDAKRIDALIERLDAVPEHQGLHDALEEACRTAAKAERKARRAAASAE